VHAAPSGAAPDLLAQIAQRLDTLHTLTRGLGDASQEAMLARLERSASAARAAERLSWVAAAAALLLSVLVSALIIRSISESLATLKRGTHEVAEGNFRYRLDTSRSDEFAQVARHFNTMTERLAELDGMKRDFVSKVSHDLKTPLASMQETVNILLDEVPGGLTEKQRKLLLLNQQAGQRLSARVAKLLALSRMEAGGLAPEFAMHRREPLRGPAAGPALFRDGRQAVRPFPQGARRSRAGLRAAAARAAHPPRGRADRACRGGAEDPHRRDARGPGHPPRMRCGTDPTGPGQPP